MRACDIKYIITDIKSSSFYRNCISYKYVFSIIKYLYLFFPYIFYISRKFQIIFFDNNSHNIKFFILKNYFLIEFTIMYFDCRILFN